MANNQLFERVSKKLLNEGSEEAVSNLLSLLASPDFKKHMDRLVDTLSEQEFAVIEDLYNKLYAELKKHEI